MRSAEAGVRYLDSSAIIKLVVEEPQSDELERSLQRLPAFLASSELALTEVPRALRRTSSASGERRTAQVDSLTSAILETLTLVPLNRRLLIEAGAFDEQHLGSLDAIHISSAASLGSSLGSFISYDRRQIDVAERAGLPVSSPGLDG